MRRRLGYDSILREQGWQPCGRANVCARLRQTVPLPIREQAWELYYEVEQLTRLAALQCGYPPDTRRTASVLELIRGILKNNKPLLTPPTDAREWCRDITDMARKVNRVVDPPQTRVVFDACPFCRHGIVWSTPRAHMGGCKSCGAHK